MLALALVVTGLVDAGAAAFRSVILDPGHGGHDKGARRSYYFEKHLALDVAFRVEKYLEARGVPAELTRRRDQFITLDSRPAKANAKSGSVFVSIHFNSATRSGANGIETFYYSSSSKRFATYVQNGLLKHTRAVNRGVKYARFRVLRMSRKPAILVECGFLTNTTERKKCLDPAYRQRLAEGIGAGILAYRRSG